MGSHPGKLIRQRILAAFDGLPPGATLTRDDLAHKLQRAHTTIGNVTGHMQRAGELVNTSPPGRLARYRQAHAGSVAVADARVASATAGGQQATDITPPRTWHAAATAPAAAGDLNPWAGTPLREGALDAAALPSRGIKA